MIRLIASYPLPLARTIKSGTSLPEFAQSVEANPNRVERPNFL